MRDVYVNWKRKTRFWWMKTEEKSILLEKFSNCVPKHSNSIAPKYIKFSTQTDQQTKNNIQTYTASNNYRTIITRAKENDKNQKKLNIYKLNSITCDKIHVNENSNN